MYNPDFWEIPVGQAALERAPNESAVWFESWEEREERYRREDRVGETMPRLMQVIGEGLTTRQREAVLLYFFHRKTQQEIAQITGISRRVLSQHLFGIVRNGRQVGGAMKRLRKRCAERGIGVQLLPRRS